MLNQRPSRGDTLHMPLCTSTPQQGMPTYWYTANALHRDRAEETLYTCLCTRQHQQGMPTYWYTANALHSQATFYLVFFVPLFSSSAPLSFFATTGLCCLIKLFTYVYLENNTNNRRYHTNCEKCACIAA